MASKIDPSAYSIKRDHLPLATFKKLWEELRRELKDKYHLNATSEIPGSARYYGMGEFAPPDTPPGMNTVATIIAGHERVKDFLEAFPGEMEKVNFGDYLYKRLREMSARPEPAFINFGKRAYVYGYFLFLGFSNRQEFEKHHKLDGGPGTAPLPPKPDVEPLPPTRYLGSFFSFRSYVVKHFFISIDFNNPIKENVFPANEWGFHRLEDTTIQQENDPDTHQQYTLSGQALIRNNKFYLNLSTAESEHIWTQMNIIGWGYGSKSGQLKSQRIIRCNIQTVSVLGYPVAAEAVLVRIDEKKWEEMQLADHQIPVLPQIKDLLGDQETDTLLLYLMMQRRNFWIRDEYVGNLLDLQVRGNLMQNYLYLKGIWRVWNYGLRRGHVVQSKLVIDEHFSTTFCPYLKPDILDRNRRMVSQVATLSISKGIQPNKLFFYTYLKPNLSVINSAMFDLDTITQLGFAEGMFFTGGYDSNGIIGGYCVMKKLKAGEADFVPQEFTWEEAKEYEKNHQLTGLYEGLRNLWRKKTWPRRKEHISQMGNLTWEDIQSYEKEHQLTGFYEGLRDLWQKKNQSPPKADTDDQ